MPDSSDSDGGMDVAVDVADIKPRNCYQYTEEGACMDAGCDFFQGAAPRICIDERGKCVMGSPDEGACGCIDSEFSVDNVPILHYASTGAGEFLVREFSIVTPKPKNWETCLENGLDGPVREGAPPECDCALRDLTPGKCPEGN